MASPATKFYRAIILAAIVWGLWTSIGVALLSVSQLLYVKESDKTKAPLINETEVFYEQEDFGELASHSVFGAEYGACGFNDAPNETPRYSSLEKHVVLRSVYWDSRQFRRLHSGFWVFLAIAEKKIVLENLIVGAQVNNDSFYTLDVKELELNEYIDTACPKLTHMYIVVRCNAPFVYKPGYAALLYKTEKDGTVMSAVSENPPVTDVAPSRGTKRRKIVSCLAPVHGNPKLLPHWIRYERTIGVSHIHIIADESFAESGALNDTVVKRALETSFLTVVIWPRRFTSWQVFYREQVLAYQDCVHRFQGLYDYVFPHDTDDFFVPLVSGANLSYYIDNYCPKGACIFFWEQIDPPNSGLTGPIGRDGNVTDKVGGKHSRRMRETFKSIHRLEDTFEVKVHEPVSYVQCCMATYVPNSAAYVSHVRY